jgi:hypothetical protein
MRMLPDFNSMPIEQLGQFLAGTIICAVLIFALIIAYYVLSRQSSRPQPKTDLGARGSAASQRPASPTFPAVAAPSAPAKDSAPAAPPTIDIGARLAGTGREAWLQEAAPPAQTPPSPLKEILRLVHDPLTGQTWVKVAGMRYRGLLDIRDRTVGERVLAAITYALRFSNGRVATDQGVASLPLPACDSVKLPAAFGSLSEAQEAGEILRLASDPVRNDFCIQVADRSYRRLVDVTDQAIGQHILEGITRLLQFSNGMIATDDGMGMVPLPALSAAMETPLPRPPAPPVADDLTSPPAPPVPDDLTSPPESPSPAAPLSEQERFLRQLMSEGPSPSSQPMQMPGLMSSLRGTWKKSSPASSPELNLVTEINRIFQSKLGVSPLANTDAEVQAGPDGGVRIRVGAVFYDSPNDVPDARLRELLKLSIAEWEQQG